MTRRLRALAAALVTLAGCASVDEPPPLVEPQPAPPATAERRAPIAKVVPAPVPSPAPAPAVKPAPPAPQLTRASEVETLVTEFERLRRLPAAELAREQDSARQAFNQTRSDAARLRLVMALAAPPTPASEGALELLEPIARNPAAPLHALAYLMASYIQEQRRLASQVQGLQQNVQGLQQNVQALQQKLDALRTLERSLTERESGAPRRR